MEPGNDDEAALEGELEAHLEENRASLQAVDEALATDGENAELITIREELHQAVKAAEESLLHLKRARLYREVDAMASRLPEVPAEAISERFQSADVEEEEEEEEEVEEEEAFPVNSRCRFRHSDGRWYNGSVLGVEDDHVARVAFLHPISDKMQMCRFFLQQQCRFGAKCRLSHGLEIQLNALRPFEPPAWNDIALGSTVLAEAKNGLWRAAELESWDAQQQRASIVFTSDGTRAHVPREDLAMSEYASASDASSSGTSPDEASDAEEEESSLFGVQTETVTFAHWEKHTRGVASKMMASMGFREGMGLGRAGQGITQPVKVQIRPMKQSLGYEKEEEAQDGHSKKKKKARGGKRKRDQKWAAAQRAAKTKVEVMEETRNVFDFINNQLTGIQKTKPVTQAVSHDSSNRATIVAREDEIKELRSKVSKLQEMATRNRKEKTVFEAVGRKLVEARSALASAEAAQVSTINSIHSKEKERKWLRF